jgi:hypothetical protein
VDIDIHSPIRLHGVMLIEELGKLYTFYFVYEKVASWSPMERENVRQTTAVHGSTAIYIRPQKYIRTYYINLKAILVTGREAHRVVRCRGSHIV